jgi:hypothetical protein
MYKKRTTGRQRNDRARKLVIEAIPGPETYIPGGFTTNVDTSALRELKRVEVAAVLEGMTLRSGALGNNASGSLFAQVVSAGVSGNQVGIACYNLSGVVSGSQGLAELVSGQDLTNEVFKVMAQGY